jgi:predicted Holliday junction resolvase-like endonuclease
MSFILVLILICVIVAQVIYLYLLPSVKTSPNDLEQANQQIGKLQELLQQSNSHNEFLSANLKDFEQRLEKLQHQKISSDVKLGQKSEHLLPFLESFPYKDDEIKGLFQPVDLIVFRQDEIVFVEVKTGAAQLSEKERRIRDNIKAGRVRFEVHRMNEKGVSVK